MRRWIWLPLGVFAFAAGAGAHLRILHPSTKAPLYWSNPAGVSVVIQADGSADIPDQSDALALRLAIETWNQTPGTIAHLVEDTNPNLAQGTNWQSAGVHLLWFDETNTSGYFPNGSGTVALTPIWFYSDGRISDADVLFNGSGFGFTTDAVPGRFDVQDVATHELGHLLGLDHSGVSGSTMYPYVDPLIVLHRSLSLDDRGGLRAAYPDGDFGRIVGRVVRPGGAGVFGAQVVARDASGRLASAGVCDPQGDFALEGLDAGTYSIYCAPLEAPVSGANMTGSPVFETDFEPTFVPGSIAVASGQTVAFGNLPVDPDVDIQLGRAGDRLPLRAIRGQTTTHSLRGTGLNSSSTLSASVPEITVSASTWVGSYVVFELTTPADCPLGHSDLLAVNGAAEKAVLVGAVEITPPDPILSSVGPALGSAQGGVHLTLSGANFRPGCRVVIGDRIYADGQPGGLTFVDEQTLELTTQATLSGTWDAVVIDETGVEGRLTNAFQAGVVPAIQSVFPSAGSISGGTPVTLAGQDFVDGLSVLIEGVPQSGVLVLGSGIVRFDTNGGQQPGLYMVELVNPGGETASALFSFAASSDPEIQSLNPTVGASEGGEPLILTGQHFPLDVEVWFGVDPLTGQGGSQAQVVNRVDANTLELLTPAGSGMASVVVRSEGSGQAAVLASGFQYVSGKGGGACVMAPPGDGSGPTRMLPLLALLALSIALARRPSATPRIA